jgi:hypothetical protein
MRVHPDGTIEVSSPEEAVRISQLLAAHQGDQPAPGKTGGEPAPATATAETTAPPAVRGGRAGVRRKALRDARPVAAEKGGPPAPRRAASETQACKRCGKEKTLDQFARSRTGTTWKVCRACQSEIVSKAAGGSGKRRRFKDDDSEPEPVARPILERIPTDDERLARIKARVARRRRPLRDPAGTVHSASRKPSVKWTLKRSGNVRYGSVRYSRCLLAREPESRAEATLARHPVACGALVFRGEELEHCTEVHGKTGPVDPKWFAPVEERRDDEDEAA